MDSSRYKIILKSRTVYEEIVLPFDFSNFKIGTGRECEWRLDRQLFFEPFFVSVIKNADEYMIACSDNLYLDVGGDHKLVTKELVHDSRLCVRYQISNSILFDLFFSIDFDYEEKRYDHMIDIAHASKLTIGGSDKCDIVINDEFLGDDVLALGRSGSRFIITDHDTQYGVYLNGARISKPQVLNEHDFFSIAGYSFYYKKDKLYTCGSDLKVKGLTVTEIQDNTTGPMQYPKFNRNTRLKLTVPDDPITVLDPPPMPHKPKNKLLTSLMPAFGMLAVTVVLRGVMGGGGDFIILGAMTMSIGIITAIIAFITSGRDYKKESEERFSGYMQYIRNKKEEIANLRLHERKALESIYFAHEREREIVRAFSGELFDRSLRDADFLKVYLGTGDIPARRVIEYNQKEKLEVDDELALLPEQIARDFACVKKAPVFCDLNAVNAVGVIGESDQLYEIMKKMMLDVCVRHYYKEVKVALLVPEKDAEMAEWARWLPHIRNDDIKARNIACDSDSTNVVLEYLYRLLSDRENGEGPFRHHVVFVYNKASINKHPISQFIEKAKDLGFTFVFFDNHKEALPKGCDRVIFINKRNLSGRLVQVENANNAQDFEYKGIPEADAFEMARMLAPVHCEEVSLESSLTKSISLFELLNIFSADDLDLAQRWRSSEVHKSMAAPLGVKAEDEIVYLDVHEKIHGPHGLVAGAAGSGKSEMLQSYILSMATLFHPYEVSFVIIDFKDGGLANRFSKLPHLAGAITNINGKDINRSLQSIKAELEKRERLFAQAKSDHIDGYIRKFKEKEVTVPVPHLIIIVDEFAELKATQPKFMKELINAARVGRGLGIHLILATQNASQINEQISSNSKFKLCLKMQAKEESKEAIKSPLAAEIKEPGRAYLQVGGNEIFELFQAAYSGASAKSEGKQFAISEVSLSGNRKIVFQQKKSASDEKSDSQLDAIVAHVDEYCSKNGIGKLPDIFLPLLETGDRGD